MELWELTAREAIRDIVVRYNGLDHWGHYVDEYGCGAKGWHIQHRKIYVDGVTPNGWGEAYVTH